MLRCTEPRLDATHFDSGYSFEGGVIVLMKISGMMNEEPLIMGVTNARVRAGGEREREREREKKMK